MGNFLKDVKNGIITENPVFVMLLGMCPTLGITTVAMNGIGMGLATTFVLLGSNIVISLLRKVIPSEVRIPSFIVIIATFVTLVDMLMNAYFPDLHGALGVFIPLIVVNCLILQRAEAMASKNKLNRAIGDAVGMGLGFTIAITSLAAIREILGNGTLFDFTVIPNYTPFRIMNESSGAFIALGFMLAFIKWYQLRKGGSRA